MSPWQPMGTAQRLRAVLSSPTLYELAQGLDFGYPLGRPRNQPVYVDLAFGVLARLSRSGHRAVTDLADPAVWGLCREVMTDTIAAHGYDLPPPPARAPRWHHWRRLRDDHLTTDDGLTQLAALHRPLAVRAAQSLGLLDPRGPGSLTHPHPSRAVYGDATTVRPIYRPPAAVRLPDAEGGPDRILYPDPTTGLLRSEPPGRHDPDIAEYHGGTGPVLGHTYVAWHVRGAARYQRITLGIEHVPAPGMEAETSLHVLGSLHRLIGPGMLAAVYDGAWHGVHLDHVMTRFGILALAPMPRDSRANDTATTPLVRLPSGSKARSHPLGLHTHTTDFGPCVHQLAAIDGALAEIDLDDSGDPVVTSWPARGPIKRARRTDGAYHLNVGYRIPCPAAPFDVWISPHAGPGADAARPHRLRVIHEHDPDWPDLYPLRSDAESTHAMFKRTLLVDRAMSLGWRRGLVDYYCFALMANALTEHRWLHDTDMSTTKRRARTAANQRLRVTATGSLHGL